jgi:biopolymer transport protein ExbB/TolQ
MGDSPAYIGIALALIALGERVYDKYNTRRSNKERAEAERIAARDKMEFDAEFREAKAQVAALGAKAAELAAGHAQCREDSAKLEAKVGELERRLEEKARVLATQDKIDKRDLEAKIDKLKE